VLTTANVAIMQITNTLESLYLLKKKPHQNLLSSQRSKHTSRQTAESVCFVLCNNVGSVTLRAVRLAYDRGNLVTLVGHQIGDQQFIISNACVFYKALLAVGLGCI
jgi:hypothetical protein